MRGYFSLVLHTHMPYVRKNGVFPVGEDWLYQAMSDTYLPLLGMLAQLEGEGVSSLMALTLTPVLCEQLADPYIMERFAVYLDTMAKHCERDISDFIYFEDDNRRKLAEAYREDFERKLLAYAAIGGDILGAIASFEEEGTIETVASSATHAFLPALGEKRAVKRQIAVGIESHRRHLGVNPRGFWLPECAYSTGVEKLLESEGVRYVMVDPTALEGRPSTRPYLADRSGLAVLARSERAHMNVWDDTQGYPADARYMDSTKYYHGSGLRYWRVSGPGVSIEKKSVYEPRPAMSRALDHTTHFVNDIADELAGADADIPTRPFVLASYDTELFGHGWREGLYWMEITLRSLAGSAQVQMVTPSGYLSANPPRERVQLCETTWGTGRDNSTWVNPETAWMWDELAAVHGELEALQKSADDDELSRRATAQAVREVLLLESSDWPYMVAKDRAKTYAIQRFRAHLERFRRIAVELETGDRDRLIETLDEVEETDNLFSALDLATV